MSARFFAAFVCGTLLSLAAQGSETFLDPQWLKHYQYRQQGLPGFRSYVSDIESDRFFFSPNGKTNPEQEFKAALTAFSTGSDRHGTLQLPAACSFPARLKILERITGRSFPRPSCPDLDQWIDRIKPEQISLVFVGAYAGNAASILGHTFLRLGPASSSREGSDLLTHSVGYTAHTNPDDNRLTYIVKGLMGGYPGFYDIEPYYMKVGLYNNAESRDLWDVPLRLTVAESKFLTEVIWEYTFNSQIPYGFVKKNCSYRLLKLLEIVRPELEVSDSFSGVVLPAETVRVLMDVGLAENNPRFRASVQRRLKMKRDLLSPAEDRQFQEAFRSIEAVSQVQEPTVLDALLDAWLFENYKVQTNLKADRKDLMEATFRRAAEVGGRSRFQLSHQEIKQQKSLIPPFLGHRPRWVEVGVGVEGAKAFSEITTRAGVHPRWSTDPGYREISSIEFLGASARIIQDEVTEWELLVIRAQTLEEFFGGEASPSWGFDLQVGNQNFWTPSNAGQASASVQWGLATKSPTWEAALLPELVGTSGNGDTESEAAVGARALLRLFHNTWGLDLEHRELWIEGASRGRSTLRLTHRWTAQQTFILKQDGALSSLSAAFFF